MHGRAPERHKTAETRRAALWGLALPALTILALLTLPALGAALLLVWPVQVLRLWRRSGDLAVALALTFGKLAEGQGVATYWWRNLTGGQRRLIEYK
jgi:hypothetical protein